MSCANLHAQAIAPSSAKRLSRRCYDRTTGNALIGILACHAGCCCARPRIFRGRADCQRLQRGGFRPPPRGHVRTCAVLQALMLAGNGNGMADCLSHAAWIVWRGCCLRLLSLLNGSCGGVPRVGVELNPSVGAADRGLETEAGGGADQETGAATGAAPGIVAGEAKGATVLEAAGMCCFSLR